MIPAQRAQCIYIYIYIYIHIYIYVMKHGRRFMTIRPTVEMQASWVNKTLMNGLD